MRSLNECLADGRSIPVKYDRASLLDGGGESSLHDLMRDELQRVATEKDNRAAKLCAEEVKKRYDGKPCMGTSIHSFTPSYETHQQFFYDEEYMTKCLDAKTSSNRSQCAGSGYFRFVQHFFHSHYYLYDNGCEGIRNGCTEANQLEPCAFTGTLRINPC